MEFSVEYSITKIFDSYSPNVYTHFQHPFMFIFLLMTLLKAVKVCSCSMLWLWSLLDYFITYYIRPQISLVFFQCWTVSASRFGEVNCVSVRLSSGNVAAKAFGCLYMYTHAWHMSACLGCSLLFSLGFSRPPPPIITTLCPLVLVLFSFSFSLPPSFSFCSTLAHFLHLLSRSSLLRNGAVQCGHAASITEKESGGQ